MSNLNKIDLAYNRLLNLTSGSFKTILDKDGVPSIMYELPNTGIFNYNYFVDDTMDDSSYPTDVCSRLHYSMNELNYLYTPFIVDYFEKNYTEDDINDLSSQMVNGKCYSEVFNAIKESKFVRYWRIAKKIYVGAYTACDYEYFDSSGVYHKTLSSLPNKQPAMMKFNDFRQTILNKNDNSKLKTTFDNGEGEIVYCVNYNKGRKYNGEDYALKDYYQNFVSIMDVHRVKNHRKTPSGWHMITNWEWSHLANHAYKYRDWMFGWDYNPKTLGINNFNLYDSWPNLLIWMDQTTYPDWYGTHQGLPSCVMYLKNKERFDENPLYNSTETSIGKLPYLYEYNGNLISLNYDKSSYNYVTSAWEIFDGSWYCNGNVKYYNWIDTKGVRTIGITEESRKFENNANPFINPNGLIYTGTGPIDFNFGGRLNTPSDLVGNVWEFVDGPVIADTKKGVYPFYPNNTYDTCTFDKDTVLKYYPEYNDICSVRTLHIPKFAFQWAGSNGEYSPPNIVGNVYPNNDLSSVWMFFDGFFYNGFLDYSSIDGYWKPEKVGHTSETGSDASNYSNYYKYLPYNSCASFGRNLGGGDYYKYIWGLFDNNNAALWNVYDESNVTVFLDTKLMYEYTPTWKVDDNLETYKIRLRFANTTEHPQPYHAWSSTYYDSCVTPYMTPMWNVELFPDYGLDTSTVTSGLSTINELNNVFQWHDNSIYNSGQTPYIFSQMLQGGFANIKNNYFKNGPGGYFVSMFDGLPKQTENQREYYVMIRGGSYTATPRVEWAMGNPDTPTMTMGTENTLPEFFTENIEDQEKALYTGVNHILNSMSSIGWIKHNTYPGDKYDISTSQGKYERAIEREFGRIGTRLAYWDINDTILVCQIVKTS